MTAPHYKKLFKDFGIELAIALPVIFIFKHALYEIIYPQIVLPVMGLPLETKLPGKGVAILLGFWVALKINKQSFADFGFDDF